MDIKVLATILIIGHLVSVTFILLVLKKQYGLFKLSIDHNIKVFRRVLFFLSIAIFMGNIIPITVDGLTIFNHIQRSTNHVNAVGLWYSMSNMLTAIFSSLLIWTLYLLAARTQDNNDIINSSEAISNKEGR